MIVTTQHCGQQRLTCGIITPQDPRVWFCGNTETSMTTWKCWDLSPTYLVHSIRPDGCDRFAETKSQPSKHPKIGFDDRLNASTPPQCPSSTGHLSTFHYSVRTPGTVEGPESRPGAGRNGLSRSALCSAIWVLQELVLWVHGRDSCRGLFVGFLLTANTGHGVDRTDQLAS
ncbi:hypothetical protein BKA56DRAFT_300761 [Ilyonectria sp. MPI-CAGE-AT-0026]|nr:hypothetical protein BKA56DRAFT_300761 [Ilyonectria sp. MPI-CAGE-AT-0026]